MKKLILILAILCFTSTGFSAPFLVSDPHPACGTTGLPSCPVAAEIFADGVSIADNHALESDMSIKYDLLDPDATDFTTTPPTVSLEGQPGSWIIGAYGLPGSAGVTLPIEGGKITGGKIN